MVISIDPGVTHCGVSVVKNMGVGKVTVLDHVNVRGSRKLQEEYLEVAESHGERTGKLFRICSAIKEYLLKYPKITHIVVEAPFFSARSPRAFEALLDVIHAIKYIVSIPEAIELISLEPTLVKKVFTGKGNSKKEIMLEYINKKIDSKDILVEERESLTEHEIDSIAVGYTFFNMEKVAVEVPLKGRKKKGK